ncbi:hypothetical protein [Streptomyces sp. NPDC014793]|uniref:hypothetical protein n=1 Tax=Streptomyces sp. NPDC014793 TaxID=3364914 RepID=UPI0036FDBED8
MAVEQLPARVREFTDYLNGLLGRLDQGGGWCGVFWQRDPEGMRACLHGRELPPWDVLESLLQDLAAAHGPAVATAERDHARALHAAAVSACDALPGARDALGDRLDVMLREQRYATGRRAELTRRLAAATSREETEALRLDLAWTHDDHDRATARRAELEARLYRLDAGVRGTDAWPHPVRPTRPEAGPVAGARPSGEAPDPWSAAPAAAPAHRFEGPEEGHGLRTPPTAGPGPGPGGPERGPDVRPGEWSAGQDITSEAVEAGQAVPAHGPANPRHPGSGDLSAVQAPRPGVPDAGPASAEDPSAPRTPAPEPAPPPAGARRRRRGGARFAGAVEDDAVPVAVPPRTPAAGPEVPGGRRSPRGARFAGAAGEREEPAEPSFEAVDARAGTAVAGAVERLVRLRAEGRTGEAHVLLVEIAHWPAARLPLLADGLRHAGLGADWATLLWEAAALPAERLVAAAAALEAAGRAADGRQMLRQGVARPAAEIGAAVLELTGRGQDREARALLDAYVRVRTPEEAARSAAVDPARLVPLLLEAAAGASEERHWDLVHALRVAGFTP